VGFDVRLIIMPLTPTQSVHGGFLVVFFGILAFLFSGLSAYVAWLVYQKNQETQAIDYSSSSFVYASSGGFLLGLILTVIGLRMAMKTGSYDTRDPKEPMIKF